MDAWAEAYARGVRQHVVLGAGLDTFAYQQPADFDGHVFEVDLPATQQWKRDCLQAAGIAEPSCLRFVPIDFTHSTLSEELGKAGFHHDRPAFFSWLGVTPYLDEAAIWETLAVVTACGAGSGVVFDFLKSVAKLSAMERVGREVMAAQVAARGEPFLSEFDPDALRAAMLERGFGTVDVLDPAELNTRFFGDGALRLRPSQGLLRAWVKP
jgi:methyltransferase (TIGR00027 family)